jgi:hypothetical protein
LILLAILCLAAALLALSLAVTELVLWLTRKAREN